jgi:NAD(P)-dependent dehydrogenase (short-subunit alcohol dehydrogenase family)
MPAKTVTLVTGAGGEPGRWPYAAAKAAALDLVRSAAIDFASAGIRVNAVCPSPIRTGMTQRIDGVTARSGQVLPPQVDPGGD